MGHYDDDYIDRDTKREEDLVKSAKAEIISFVMNKIHSSSDARAILAIIKRHRAISQLAELSDALNKISKG